MKDILIAREKRWLYTNELVKKFELPLIIITLNIPGNEKSKENYLYAHNVIINDFLELLYKKNKIIIFCRNHLDKDGPESFIIVDEEAKDLKKIGIEFEEKHPLGRIADIDIKEEKKDWSRRDLGIKERECLLCNKPARRCIVSKNHSLEEVLSSTNKIISEYKHIPKKIAELALKSMLYEATTEPKPGLVDGSNSGSHEDMNIFTFIDSSISLYPYMLQCSELGFSSKVKEPKILFKLLRQLGLEAEETMFCETKGVNTQKGLVFILGIVCANTGIILSRSKKINIKELSYKSSLMVEDIVDKELKILNNVDRINLTAGQKMYLDHGVTGIRGEVGEGLPTVMEYGLPNLYKSLNKGLNLNQAFINTLLYIMYNAEDTNVLWRGGVEAIKFMKRSVGDAIYLGGMTTLEGKKAVDNMNKKFIEKNISPGGSADLLATTIMFYLLESIF